MSDEAERFCVVVPAYREEKRIGEVVRGILRYCPDVLVVDDGSDDQTAARAREAGARPGGLIMIHGQPNAPTRSRGYYASRDWTDGCIALSNGDMAQIWQRTTIGTPIEIVP